MGLDAQPVVMPAEDVELLNDPLAAGLLLRGKFPRTVGELLSDAMKERGPGSNPWPLGP